MPLSVVPKTFQCLLDLCASLWTVFSPRSVNICCRLKLAARCEKAGPVLSSIFLFCSCMMSDTRTKERATDSMSFKLSNQSFGRQQPLNRTISFHFPRFAEQAIVYIVRHWIVPTKVNHSLIIQRMYHGIHSMHTVYVCCHCRRVYGSEHKSIRSSRISIRLRRHVRMANGAMGSA